MLEESNVNASKNMIEMISNARQFEMQMKMISMCDQNAEYANQLININN
ncbi:flagellar basal body rod C-terminal domain-containing protein [Buchnera aphidicola]|nr:flagellar basal body rod C-terminal domain-containing protein [Buchnera aphidicola]